jgi:hypothetical protein
MVEFLVAGMAMVVDAVGAVAVVLVVAVVVDVVVVDVVVVVVVVVVVLVVVVVVVVALVVVLTAQSYVKVRLMMWMMPKSSPIARTSPSSNANSNVFRSLLASCCSTSLNLTHTTLSALSLSFPSCARAHAF